MALYYMCICYFSIRKLCSADYIFIETFIYNKSKKTYIVYYFRQKGLSATNRVEIILTQKKEQVEVI